MICTCYTLVRAYVSTSITSWITWSAILVAGSVSVPEVVTLTPSKLVYICMCLAIDTFPWFGSSAVGTVRGACTIICRAEISRVVIGKA